MFSCTDCQRPANRLDHQHLSFASIGKQSHHDYGICIPPLFGRLQRVCQVWELDLSLTVSRQHKLACCCLTVLGTLCVVLLVGFGVAVFLLFPREPSSKLYETVLTLVVSTGEKDIKLVSFKLSNTFFELRVKVRMPSSISSPIDLCNCGKPKLCTHRTERRAPRRYSPGISNRIY